MCFSQGSLSPKWNRNRFFLLVGCSEFHECRDLSFYEILESYTVSMSFFSRKTTVSLIMQPSRLSWLQILIISEKSSSQTQQLLDDTREAPSLTSWCATRLHSLGQYVIWYIWKLRQSSIMWACGATIHRGLKLTGFILVGTEKEHRIKRSPPERFQREKLGTRFVQWSSP